MVKLSLRFQDKEKVEKTVTVKRDEFIVGRLPECDLHLPYLGISRWHTRFLKTPHRGWLVEDLKSKNGTRLNGELLKSPQTIKSGDIVLVGTIPFTILLEEPTTDGTALKSSTKPTTILRSVEHLQEQWIKLEDDLDKSVSQEKTIARLRDLVDIAKGLNSAESIEAIFFQVQAVVFRYLKSIERLALLIDVTGAGKLRLIKAAARNVEKKQKLTADESWVSRSICHKVFSSKVAIHTADAQIDKRFEGEDSILRKGIRTAMAVPLWDENKVVGVLYGDGHLSLGYSAQASEEDLRFFSTLGNLVASSVQRWLLTRKLRNEAVIRQKLERYHSPAVVQQLMRAGAWKNGRLLPTEREISILFADIVGFTALSERLTPTELAELLNNFFEEMLKEVFSVGGTLDKFIGDCIMAFFGAPEPQADHAERAIAAAQGMLKRLDKLNENHSFTEPLELRIAINSGKAVVGDLGSSQRVDYTVLGGTINLASRMEAVCPVGKCVISEATYSLLKVRQGFEVMGEYRFKGINRSIRVYKTQDGE